ncbi:MAG: DUF1552 domain-containing protein [Verrucomicrobiota bacterium]|nr:DUF1552 domain-containing protein [Verrucomicrobiota bacterium]
MKTLGRRNFLRGMGSSMLALPWMESLARGASGMVSPQRAAFYYVPIGVVRQTFFPGEDNGVVPKFNNENFDAEQTQSALPIGIHPLELTQTMKPLHRVKDKVTLITGMDRTFQPGTDVHAQCASCFLSSASPFSLKHTPYPQARTLDHVIADKIGTQTPFKTLEFSCNSHKDNKESIQFDNISWYGNEHVAPSMRDPLLAYRRLFKSDESSAYRNITDLVLEDARSLKNDLGYSDQQKFGEYFESIRAIELQVSRLDGMKRELSKVDLDIPMEGKMPRGEYIRLMGDLMVAALQSGLTNVATFMVGPERWDTPYLFESLFDKPKSHHQMSHNQGRFIEDLIKVDHFYMEQFAYLVEKMDRIEEANGKSLLDNILFTYGSGLGDGATHQYSALPIIVAGSGGGKFITGKHLNVSSKSGLVKKVNGTYKTSEGGVPLADLWLTQARAMGVEIGRFADSTGVLPFLMS